MEILNILFNKIPDAYIESFSPTYNLNIVDKMKEYKKNGWDVMIITNAPEKIVNLAKQIFKVEVKQARISCKSNLLNDIDYKNLKVVTDNITDMDLIMQADDSIVLLDKMNEKYFNKNKLEKATFIYKDKCLKGKKIDD